MQKYYTPEELAEIFTLHKKTIYRWIRAGRIESYKMGRGWRVSQKQLNKFLEENLFTEK